MLCASSLSTFRVLRHGISSGRWQASSNVHFTTLYGGRSVTFRQMTWGRASGCQHQHQSDSGDSACDKEPEDQGQEWPHVYLYGRKLITLAIASCYALGKRCLLVAERAVWRARSTRKKNNKAKSAEKEPRLPTSVARAHSRTAESSSSGAVWRLAPGPIFFLASLQQKKITTGCTLSNRALSSSFHQK